MDWHELFSPACWSLVHLTALAAACLSRLSLGHGADRAIQGLAAAGFLAVASAAVLAGAQGGDHLRLCVLSGTTLGVMIVAALVERRADEIDPLLQRFAAVEDR